MGMESTLKNSLFISIFVIAIISFAVNFAYDNDSSVSIVSDSSYTNLNASLRNNLSSFRGDSQNSQEYFMGTSIASGDSEISGSGAQFKVGPFTAIGMTISSLNTSFKAIFGPEFYFILGSFAALFGMLVGYYAVKAWLGRDPS